MMIGCAQGNFRAGRPAGLAPVAVVLHRSGTRDVLRARFNDGSSGVSAHYAIGRDGAIDQYVLETDTAFHAGLVVNPTWPLIRPGVNPNFYTIGVELEGRESDDWPAPQLAAAGALIRGVAGRWQFPIDAEHIVRHRAIRESSACPPATCPIGDIMAFAQRDAPLSQVPRDTVVRTMARTNLRRGSPHTRAPIDRVIDAGVELVVTGFTDDGDSVNGNAFWYRDDADRFLWAGATNVPDPARDPVLSELDIASPSTDAMELGLRPATADEPSAIDDLAIDRSTFALAAKEFFPDVTPKSLVVLHFTAGTSARSAFETWRNDPQHVATAYLVDSDGKIYEVFPPSRWAAHLGVKGTNHLHDRRSIGIEIANVGPLVPAADDRGALNWWPPKSKNHPEFTTKFCSVDDRDRYVESAFRGKSHFASFPNVQVDAVASLVRHVCDRFAIPRVLPPLPQRFTCDVGAFASFKGVCTHANFRQDKWDIGPAFPWERLGL
jgi:N-acetyl-anhydromuramyl-L-alanine amidase AmpD